MIRHHIDEIERDKPSERDLKDALEQVLLVRTDERPRSENREPRREDLGRRYRLERRD